MSNQPGIIYLIQPCELIGTNRYKIGCSEKLGIDRCTQGYKKGSRVICIIKCVKPFDNEKKIKQIFNNKFKLIAGNEYFEGDEDQMLIEFIKIWEESINSEISKEFEEEKQKESSLNYQEDNEDNDDNEEDNDDNEEDNDDNEEDNYDNQDEEYYEEKEEIYEITTYEEFIKDSEIEKIIITNKKKLEGYLKFRGGNYWRKLDDKKRLDWNDDIMENLEGFIEHNANKPFDYNIDKIAKDIAKKCYVKDIEYYKLKYNEYVFWEPSDLRDSRYYILDTKTFEYKSINSLGDKIITGRQIGGRGFYIHGTIDTNIVINILNSLLSSEDIIKFRKFAYKVFVEKSNNINIFYDYNEKLLSTWLNDTLYTIAGGGYVVDSDSYYDDKKKFIKDIKVRKPRYVSIYTGVQYISGKTKKYKHIENQIEDFKKLGFTNFIVNQKDKNINMYNLKNFRNYLGENKETITSLCKTKGNTNEIRFGHDDDIFYTQGLLQADFLKWCCTKS